MTQRTLWRFTPGVTPKSSFDAAEEEKAPVGWLVAAAAATCRLQKADEWLLEGFSPPNPHHHFASTHPDARIRLTG